MLRALKGSSVSIFIQCCYCLPYTGILLFIIYQGSMGPPGTNGLKGEKGDMGSTGSKGQRGDKGQKGVTVSNYYKFIFCLSGLFIS